MQILAKQSTRASTLAAFDVHQRRKNPRQQSYLSNELLPRRDLAFTAIGTPPLRPNAKINEQVSNLLTGKKEKALVRFLAHHVPGSEAHES